MTRDRIVGASVAATLSFVVTAALGVFVDAVRPIAVVVALTLFVGGAIGMLGAVVIAAGRSRTHAIGIHELFFLADAAPSRVRRVLLGCVGVQVAVGLSTAIARPYSSMAFGVLAPVAGLAACGVWAAMYGEFGPRT